MKNLKRLLLLLLCAVTVLGAVACGDIPPAECTAHVDADKNGKCDVCDKDVPPEEKPEEEDESKSIELIKDGEVQFQFVVSSELGSSVKAVDDLIKDMKKDDYDVVKVSDTASSAKDIEVLVGPVTSRGKEYEIDIHTLGYDGYIIKMVGSKVLIVGGGSADAIKTALEVFAEDILELEDEPENVTMTDKMEVDEAMSKEDYRIPSVTVNGTDVADYKITVDASGALDKYKKDYNAAAKTLQDTLYQKAGYWLPIVDAAEAGDKVISICDVEDAGKNGFRVIARDNDLFIECSYSNKFGTAFSQFVASKLTTATKAVDFKDTFYNEYNASIVTYKEFDAKADGGKTADFVAMKNAHDFANECGQTVVATNGKTYHIDHFTSTYHKDENGKNQPDVITIKTNVNFGTAKFTLDDSQMEMNNAFAKSGIFEIVSDYAPITVKATDTDALGLALKAINDNKTGNIALASGTVPTINFNLGYKAMVILYNDNHLNYIRYGANENNGDKQHEVILINEDGSVDASTPLLHDFTEVTRAIIYRADDTTITIKGGIFTTYANCAKPTNYFAYKRGFTVSRSNTVVEGMEHYVTGEGEFGAAYSAFHIATLANNIIFKDNIYTAHKTYDCMGSGGVQVAMGTYDISANNANNVTWDNCKQSNFFHEDGITPSNVALADGTYYWGIMGANYVKNISYVNGCELSRFDAHAGVYNGTIKDSKVTALAIIGGGTLTIENSTIHPTSGSILSLRDDYGSTFKGDIIFKDTTIKFHSDPSAINLLAFTHRDHDFGYTTYMPKTVTVDNLTLSGTTKTDVNLVNVNNSKLDLSKVTKNATVPMEKLIIKNNTNGYGYYINKGVSSSEYKFFKDTEIVYE